jgi:hypothetical protein
MAMMRRPPEWPVLQTARAGHGHDELEGTAGLVRAVREVAVEEGGDREHPERVEGDAEGDRHPADTDPQCHETTQVNADECDVQKEVLDLRRALVHLTRLKRAAIVPRGSLEPALTSSTPSYSMA